MPNPSQRIKEEMIQIAQLSNIHPDLVTEYIKEAEHQDGIGYWYNNFQNGREAFEDLELYLSCRIEKEG